MESEIKVEGDAIEIAKDNLKVLAEGKKIEKLMSILVQINNIELDIKLFEKRIAELRGEMNVINSTDILEFIKVNPGESINFSSTTGCRYQL